MNICFSAKYYAVNKFKYLMFEMFKLKSNILLKTGKVMSKI